LAEVKIFGHRDTHRLILGTYVEGFHGLETLPLRGDVLSDLSELDAATNERIVAERGRSQAITVGELVFGIPEAKVVNAAFTHPGESGARFSNRTRGAWYAAVELETAYYEVAFHKQRFLRDSRIQDPIDFVFIDFLADFANQFHHLSPTEAATCLVASPVPQCYGPGQSLAATLLYSEASNGIIYKSVRDLKQRECIACFRPPLVGNPRRASKSLLNLEAGRKFDPRRDVKL
jgi:hypothetical protein